MNIFIKKIGGKIDERGSAFFVALYSSFSRSRLYFNYFFVSHSEAKYIGYQSRVLMQNGGENRIS